MPVASSTLDTTVPYGELTVLRYAYYGGGVAGHFWRCRCSCGRELTVREHSFRYGKSRTCGHTRARQGPRSSAVLAPAARQGPRSNSVLAPDGRRFASAEEAAAEFNVAVNTIRQWVFRASRKGLADGWRWEPKG